MTRLSYNLSFPTDNGYWGRECNRCKKYFKIDADKIKDDMFCPYCGEQQPNNILWTKNQKRVINKIGLQIAKRHIEDELEKMLKSLAKGNKNITYRPGSKTPISKQKSHVEKEVDSEIECSNCKMAFQVYGIFGFCPGCREDNFQVFETNLAIILRELDSLDEQNRKLRHAYNDLVSTFELYCKGVAQKYDLGFANFQNLKNTKELFKKHDVNIYLGVSENQKVCIKRIFEKRHAYQHSKGEVTNDFVKNIPQDLKLVGTIAVLSKAEFLEGIEILKLIVMNIREKNSS